MRSSVLNALKEFPRLDRLNDEQVEMLDIIKEQSDAIDYVKRELWSGDFAEALMLVKPSIFRRFPRDFRTATVSGLAFSHDVQLISHIPDQHISEEMMFKAVRLNADLLRVPKDGFDFQSDRIAKFVLSVSSNYWDYLSLAYRTKENALFCARCTGKIPTLIDDLKLSVDIIVGILDDEEMKYCPKLIDKIIHGIETLKEESNKELIYQAADDIFSNTHDRALACIALGLHDVEIAARLASSDPILSGIALELHDSHDLMRYISDAELKKKITEFSFDL